MALTQTAHRCPRLSAHLYRAATPWLLIIASMLQSSCTRFPGSAATNSTDGIDIAHIDQIDSIEEQKDHLVSMRRKVAIESAKGNFEDARKYIQEVIELDKKLFKSPSDQIELGKDLRNLAFIYCGIGNLSAASTALEESLKVIKALPGHHELLVAEITRDLCGFQEPFTANAKSEEALQLARTNLPRGSARLLAYLQVRAATLCGVGQAERAEIPLKKALQIIKTEKLRKLNEVQCYLGLAQAYLAQRKYKLAIDAAQQAIDTASAERSKMPHTYWSAIIAMAAIYATQKDYATAEKMLSAAPKDRDEWERLPVTQRKQIIGIRAELLQKQHKNKQADQLLRSDFFSAN